MRVQSLREELSQLEKSLVKGLNNIREGQPPSRDLAYTIFQLREDFEELRKNIIRETNPSDQSEALLRTLEDLEELLPTAAPPHAELHREATEVLHRVLRIRDTKKAAESLSVVQDDARALLEEIDVHAETEHPEARGLIEGDHPLGALLKLIEDKGELSDETWSALDERVRNFSSKLAVALNRGRLEVREETPGAVRPTEEEGESSLQEGLDDDNREDSSSETTSDTEPGDIERPSLAQDEGASSSETSLEGGSRVSPTKEQSEPGADGETEDDHGGNRSSEASGIDDDSEDTAAQKSDSQQVEPSDDPVNEPGLEGPDSSPEEERTVAEGGQRTVLSGTDVRRKATGRRAAEKLKEDPSDLRTQGALLGSLLHREHHGIAYHLFEALENTGHETLTPSWLLRSYLLGPYLRSQDGNLAPRLQFTHGIEDLNIPSDRQGHVRWLMVFGAVLRPALHAPRMTSALDVLDQLPQRNELEPLSTYADRIYEYAYRRGKVGVRLVAGVDEESLEEKLDQVKDEIRRWKERSGKRTSTYVPATQTWHAQLESGAVAAICDAILEYEEEPDEQLSIVQDRIGDVTNPDIQGLFRETTGKDDELEGAARAWLKNQFNEFHDLASRWLALAKDRSDPEEGKSEEEALSLVRTLREERYEPVREVLHSFSEEHDGILLGVVAQRVGDVIDEIHRHLSGDTTFSTKEPSIDRLLHDGLLRIPDLFPTNGSESAARRLESLLTSIASDELGWEKAFEEFVGQNRFDLSQKVVDAVRRSNSDSAVDADTLDEHHEERLERTRLHLRNRAQDVQEAVENAFQLGYVDYNDRAYFLEVRDHVLERVDWKLDLGELYELLREVKEGIQESKRQAVNQVRKRFNNEEVQKKLEGKESSRLRIKDVIEEGDVYTAHAYIDRIVEDDSLPEESEDEQSFDTFFPGRLRAIQEKYGSGEALHTLSQTLSDGEDLESGDALSFSDLKPEIRRRASGTLDSWLAVRREEKASEKAVEKLISALGFRPETVEMNRMGGSAATTHGEQWAEVRVTETSIRRNSPVPAYGSKTQGRYRFLLSFGSPTVEEIAEGVEEIDVDGPATVFLHFGSLGEAERREIASHCREEDAGFLVLDQPLFLYLLSYSPGERLRQFFKCTLPFTHLQPYSEVGSRVPPEMFFGRESEIDQIKDPNGPSLVYGGRQLGKTVLLRQAGHQFHEPPDRIACWIDLRSHGVSEEPRKIWPVIVGELHGYSVFEDDRVHKGSSPDKIRRHIQEWLDEDSARRILLLLDEADDFFNREEETEFEQTVRLKNLMEKTNGRFKVVFAGLHNVLRTTNSPNQPLGHLREPICVGPLLKDGEWEAARQLVKRPLEAMGYRFESEELVTFILNLTNYYPSLIQLYCRYLLEEVVDRSGRDFGSEEPPYAISETDVRESRGHADLMRQIREKFLWTLQLDPRYEVLAYSIGYRIKTEKERHVTASQNGRREPYGFSVEEARREALEWWPEGFRGSTSTEHIQALLDEMVGLGVLRKTSQRHYTLRSPNVLPLLGDTEKMKQTLEKERIVEPEFDPKTYRRHYDDGKLAPITSHQYGLLKQRSNGVAIAHGTSAAGIDQVPEFFKEKHSTELLFHVEKVDSAEKFADLIGEMKEDRKDGAVTVALVDASADWTYEWIDRALSETEPLYSKQKFFRVIFLADADRTWSLCSERWTEAEEEAQITRVHLQPWHDAALYSWFLEQEQSLKPSQLQEVGYVTGNWPFLLQRLGENMRRDPAQWSVYLETINEELDQPEIAKELLREFGFAGGAPQKVLSVLSALDGEHRPPDAGYRISSFDGQDEESGGVERNEIVEFVSLEYENTVVEKYDVALEWARRLGIASLVGKDRWRIDPLVGRLLCSVSE